MHSTLRDVYIITAPSGTGKTTLNRRLVDEVADLEISTSLTTRPQRPGENNGDHYWFVEKQRFFEYVSEGRMLEWAEVFGNYYGTSRDELMRIAASGKRPILEIDVQGWKQARDRLPKQTSSIFILPPSIAAIWERLQNRGTDSLAARWRRISTARAELDHCDDFDFFVINDQLVEAVEDLKHIVLHRTPRRTGRTEGLAHSRRLIEEFDNADWLRTIQAQVTQS